MEHRLLITYWEHSNSYACHTRGLDFIGVKQLGHLIREGNDLKVTTTLDDGLEVDITKETLLKTAVLGNSRGNHASKFDAVDACLELAEQLSNEKNLFERTLYLIIRNGGIEEYLSRRSKKLVNYEE